MVDESIWRREEFVKDERNEWYGSNTLSYKLDSSRKEDFPEGIEAGKLTFINERDHPRKVHTLNNDWLGKNWQNLVRHTSLSLNINPNERMYKLLLNFYAAEDLPVDEFMDDYEQKKQEILDAIDINYREFVREVNSLGEGDEHDRGYEHEQGRILSRFEYTEYHLSQELKELKRGLGGMKLEDKLIIGNCTRVHQGHDPHETHQKRPLERGEALMLKPYLIAALESLPELTEPFEDVSFYVDLIEQHPLFRT